MEVQSASHLLVQHLDYVHRVVRSTCRRHGLSTDDADDCCSWVGLKLLENDYETLREFRGESSIKTFLTIVVVRLVRDYRVQHWGRWRPSATAKRLGALAVRLETLVYRDGLNLDLATRVIQTGTDVAPSAREIARLYAVLPARGPVRPRVVPEEQIDQAGAAPSADARADAAEQAREISELEGLVRSRLQDLPPLDRVVMQMTYLEGLSVAEVARALNIPQKPLYRQIDRLKRLLREQLEAAGVSRERVVDLLQGLAS